MINLNPLLKKTLFTTLVVLIGLSAYPVHAAKRVKHTPVKVVSQTKQNSVATNISGWIPLTKQDDISAESCFRAALESEPGNRESLLGEAILASYRADYPKAFNSYLQMVREHPQEWSNEAIFRLLHDYQLLTPDASQLTPFYETLYKNYQNTNLPHPYLQTLIADYLIELYNRTGDTGKARKMVEEAGYIRHWDYILGPFGKYGISDQNEVFPPEEDLNQDSYPGWTHSVSRQSLSVPTNQPTIDINNWVYPNQGTVFLVTRIQIKKAAKAWLGLNTTGLGKIWVNGSVVMSITPQQSYDREENWSPVSLQSGENVIVLKLTKNQEKLAVQLQLLDAQGAPIAYSYSPLHGKEAKHYQYPRLNPENNAPVFSIPPFSFISKTEQTNTDQLLGARLCSLNNIYSEAENRFIELEKKYPGWGYLRQLRGELYSRQADAQPRSWQRLSNQSKELYEQALQLNPNLTGSIIGLTWHYLYQRQLDTALDYAKKLDILVPDSFIGPAMKTEIFYQRGWQTELDSALSTVTSRNPAYKPAYALLTGIKHKAGLSKEAEPLYRKAYEMDKTDGTAYEFLRGCLDAQGKLKQSAQLAEEFYRINGNPFEEYLTLGDYARRMSDAGSARKYYAEAVRLNPDHPLGHERLAVLSLASGDTARAINLFQDTLIKSPLRDDIRDRITALNHAKDFYTSYDLDLNSINTTGYDSSNYPRASAIYLLDLMVSEFHTDGSSRNMIHQAIKILNKQGRQKFEEIAIPPNAKLVYARTIGKDGKTYYPTEVNPTDSGKTLSMYAVEEGAVIEYCYIFSDNGGRSPGRNYSGGLYFFQEKEDPMVLSRVTYLVPDGIQFKYRTMPADFLPLTTSRIMENKPVSVYTWEKRNSKGIKEEPLMPEMKKVSVNILYSTYPDWPTAIQPLIDEYYDRAIDSPWINDKLTSLSLDTLSDGDKVCQIYDFITKKIVTQNATSGTITDALIMGTGSVQDKTLLAKVMLDHLGIANDLLIVSGDDIPQNEAGIPSPGLYGRYILHLPGKPGNIEYLDLSSQYRPVGVLGDMLQGKKSIQVTGKGISFNDIPDYSENQPNQEFRLKVLVNKNGKCQIEGLIYYLGDMSVYIRDALEDPTRKKRIMDEEVNRLFPGIQIDETSWKGLENPAEPLILIFKGTNDHLLSATQDGYVFNPLFNKLNLSRFVPAPQREYPLDLKSSLVHSDYSLELVLPETFRFANSFPSVMELSPFGQYNLNYQPTGKNTWKITRSAYIPKGKIETSNYSAFLEFCKKIDSQEKQPLKLINTLK